MLWLMANHSRTLGNYRWYIFTNVALSYVFDCIHTLIKPVFLSPFVGWYLQGILPAKGHFSVVVVIVWAMTMITMDLSIAASLLHRFSQAYFGALRDFVDSRKVLVVYAVVVIFCLSQFFFNFLVVFPTTEEMYDYARSYSPELAPFTNLNGFYAFERTEKLVMVITWVVVMFGVFFALGIVLLFVFLSRLQSTQFRRTQSKSGYRLQMMLFRVLCVQLLLIYVQLLLPGLLTLLLIVLNVSHSGPAATLMFTGTSLHASMDYVVVCYFVAPYRRAIMAVVPRLLTAK
ncbi:hypothetical protein AAVH_11345, partial [Aphelenchoides avenae]